MPTKKSLVPKRPFFTFAFFGWLAFVTYSSLTSFSDIDTESFGFEIPHADKIVHFIFYATASFLGVFFLREQRRWSVKLRKALVLMFFLTVAYGIIIEVLQYSYTTSREGDVFDAIANSFGSFCGILASSFLFFRKGLAEWEITGS